MNLIVATMLPEFIVVLASQSSPKKWLYLKLFKQRFLKPAQL